MKPITVEKEPKKILVIISFQENDTGYIHCMSLYIWTE